MKQIIIAIVLVLCMGVVSCNDNESINEKYRKGWSLVWEDNFDNSLDESVWSKTPNGDRYMNRYMSDDDKLYVFQDGKLVLRGVKNPVENDTLPFLTAGVQRKVSDSPVSRIEVRARINPVDGARPFISLLPVSSPVSSDEHENISINLMEQYDSDEFIYQTVSSEYTVTERMTDSPPSIILVKANPAQYNTYTVEKYPDSLVFYVNTTRVRKYPRILTDIKGQFPFDTIDFDLLIGTSLEKDTDSLNLPADIFIDWVRFYEPALPEVE